MGAGRGPDASDMTCPFFAEGASLEGPHRCLSGAEPATVEVWYASDYCTDARHVECRRYIAAGRRGEAGDGGAGGPVEDTARGTRLVQVGKETVPSAAPGAPHQAELGPSTPGGDMPGLGAEPPHEPLRADAARVVLSAGPRPVPPARSASNATSRPAGAGASWHPRAAVATGMLLAVLLAALVAALLLGRSEGDRGRPAAAPGAMETAVQGEVPTGVRMPEPGPSATHVIVAAETEAPAAEPRPVGTATRGAVGAITPTAERANTATPTTGVQPAETSTPGPAMSAEPTVAPTVSTADTPQPVFRSGGLGMMRTGWERTYGEPDDEVGGFVTYGGGEYLVRFIDGKVQHLQRRWDGAVPMAMAKSASRRSLPADARLVERSEPRDDRVLELYTSPSLADRFAGTTGGNDPWINLDPGTIVVLYRLEGGGVDSMAIAAGDLP